MTCYHYLVAGLWILFAATFYSSCAIHAPDSVHTPHNAPPEDAIEIRAQPLGGFDLRDPSRCNFGDLEYRGGLILESSHESFGGISALRVRPDGAEFLAASDRGFWLQGRIVYEGNRPTGIAEAVIKPILDSNGKPPDRWDVESIAEDCDILYAGIEKINSIVRFDYGKRGFLAPGEPISVPPEIRNLPDNQGLEAIVFVPDGYSLGGTLIAISEHALDESGNLQSFLIGGPMPGMFLIKRTDSYDVSDAALLPGGDLLLLERKYSLQSQASMRIRRIPMEEIKPGALVDGPVLIEADKNYQIDNMEAISVHRASSGEIILTLMSDDNFSPAQRTILLQFALRE